MAAALQQAGRLAEARQLHELAILRTGGTGELAARAWRNLGLLHELSGDLDRAARADREALAISEPRILAGNLGEVAGHVRASLRLLAVHRKSGRVQEEFESLLGRLFALHHRVAAVRHLLPPPARWAVLEFLAEASRRGWRPDDVTILATVYLTEAAMR